MVEAGPPLREGRTPQSGDICRPGSSRVSTASEQCTGLFARAAVVCPPHVSRFAASVAPGFAYCGLVVAPHRTNINCPGRHCSRNY